MISPRGHAAIDALNERVIASYELRHFGPFAYFLAVKSAIGHIYLSHN